MQKIESKLFPEVVAVFIVFLLLLCSFAKPISVVFGIDSDLQHSITATEPVAAATAAVASAAAAIAASAAAIAASAAAIAASAAAIAASAAAIAASAGAAAIAASVVPAIVVYIVIVVAAPLLHAGTKYNIPIIIWIPDQFPAKPPLCLVQPTATMIVRPGRHVDANGTVYLPYLEDWKRVSTNVFFSLELYVCMYVCMCVHVCMYVCITHSHSGRGGAMCVKRARSDWCEKQAECESCQGESFT